MSEEKAGPEAMAEALVNEYAPPMLRGRKYWTGWDHGLYKDFLAMHAAGKAEGEKEVGRLREALETVVFDCEKGAWIPDDIKHIKEWRLYNVAKKALTETKAAEGKGEGGRQAMTRPTKPREVVAFCTYCGKKHKLVACSKRLGAGGKG